MRDEPDGLSPEAVAGALRAHWGVEVSGIEYMPVGAGSYHWYVVDQAGGRWFVTADDLRFSGVQDGEQVITSGGLGLEDKAKVTVQQPKAEEEEEKTDEEQGKK